MTEFAWDPSKDRADPTFVVPDLTEAVEGWRAWRVQGEKPRFGIPPRLYSANERDYFWVPRQESIAVCRGKCPVDEIPRSACGCGFYSAKNLHHLLGMGYPKYSGSDGWYVVIGKVANWGNVIEGSLGWRAQKAYPVELYVPFEIARYIAKPLAETYGVPVQMLNWLKPKTKVSLG